MMDTMTDDELISMHFLSERGVVVKDPSKQPWFEEYPMPPYDAYGIDTAIKCSKGWIEKIEDAFIAGYIKESEEEWGEIK